MNRMDSFHCIFENEGFGPVDIVFQFRTERSKIDRFSSLYPFLNMCVCVYMLHVYRGKSQHTGKGRWLLSGPFWTISIIFTLPQRTLRAPFNFAFFFCYGFRTRNHAYLRTLLLSSLLRNVSCWVLHSLGLGLLMLLIDNSIYMNHISNDGQEEEAGLCEERL